MEVIDLSLAGLKLIVPQLFRDERGFFYESYRQSRYVEKGVATPFVQDNVSVSQKGTLRGLHFQSHPGQAKLVTCVQGTIWDVAVDIRPDSPTFLKWEAVELDDQSHKQLFVPVGFAHGFCVLSDHARVHYKVSTPYISDAECSIRWNDPDLQIAWPIQNPLLSPRDQVSPLIQDWISSPFFQSKPQIEGGQCALDCRG